MRSPPPVVVCVLPAFDAAQSISGVARGLRRALPGAELIAIDDGSADDTHDVAVAVCDSVIRFDVNRGKGAALRAGFSAALERGADAVVTIDADGQHDPAAASRLLAALDDADLVIGMRRRSGTAMPVRRRITNALASAAMSRIIGERLADTQSGYRVIRRAVIESIRARGDRYEFESDFLIRTAHAGFRVRGVEVPTIYGSASHFRGVTDTVRVVRTIWGHRARSIV